MSLEEKLRAYAAKGELVHLSLAFTKDVFVANFAAASPLGGYSTGSAADPVEAIEAALKASPVRPARVSKPKANTVTVTDPEPQMTNGSELNKAWTTP